MYVVSYHRRITGMEFRLKSARHRVRGLQKVECGMPKEIIEAERKGFEETTKDQPSQKVEEIMRIIQEARIPGQGSKAGEVGQVGTGSLDIEDDEEIDVSGDYEQVWSRTWLVDMARLSIRHSQHY